MNILRILKVEHEEVSKLFKDLHKTTDQAIKQRRELFQVLDSKLSAHTEVEEEVLYANMKRASKDASDVLEAYEEHRLAKLLLSELRELVPSHEKWGPKLKVLDELVQHHVREEEGVLFKEANHIFRIEDLDSLGKEYLAKKETWAMR